MFPIKNGLAQLDRRWTWVFASRVRFRDVGLFCSHDMAAPHQYWCEFLQAGFDSGTRGFSVLTTWRPHTNTGVRGSCCPHALLLHSPRLCSGVVNICLPWRLGPSFFCFFSVSTAIPKIRVICRVGFRLLPQVVKNAVPSTSGFSTVVSAE